MKSIFLLLFITFNVNATSYYVDNTITDSNIESAIPDFTTYNPTTFTTTGGSSYVFKTIADINAFSTLQPGDSVLFRKGQTWREQLAIPASGTNGNNITFGSFGAGSKPIISGGDVLSGWSASSLTQSISYTNTNQRVNLGNVSSQVIQVNKLVASLDACITGVEINSYRVGTPVGNVYGVIYSDSSGPSTLLATGSNVDAGAITSNTAGETITSTFSSCYNVTSGTTYYVGFAKSFDTSSSDYVRFSAYSSIVAPFSGEYKYTPWASNPWQLSLSITTSTPYPNVYINSAAHPAGDEFIRVALFDGSFGYRSRSVNELTSEKTWYTDGTDIYIYSVSDPNTLYTSPGVEISKRRYGVDFNGKEYILIDGLEVDTCNWTNFKLGTLGNNTVQKSSANYGGFYNYHSAAANTSITNIQLIDNYSSHAGGSGYSLNVATNQTPNNYLFRGNTSYRDGILGAYFNEASDENNTYYWSSGFHIFGVSGAVFEDNTVSYSGIRDDGYIPNLAVGNLPTGNGLWLDYMRGTNLTNGNIVRYNKTHNNGGYGLFNEKGAYNSFYHNLSYNNAKDGLHTDMDTGGGSGAFVTENVYYNNTVYNNTRYGIYNEGDYSLVAGSNTNNTYKNNISVGNGTNLRVENGGENDGTYGSGNIYTYNALGAESTGFIYYGSAKNTYSAFESAYGSPTHSVQNDSLLISSSDFRLQATSPAINAGVDVGLTTDYLNNPIFGLPDIGAYEYIGGSLSALDGSAQAVISNLLWDTKSRYQNKSWVESLSPGSKTVTHKIYQLTPFSYYDFRIDNKYPKIKGILGTTCQSTWCKANANGIINFNYTGDYTTNHSFEVKRNYSHGL